MKEQVSVDKVTYEAFVKFRAECLMRHHEYERLKRMDENVKKHMKRLREDRNNITERINKYDVLIFLEDLYN